MPGSHPASILCAFGAAVALAGLLAGTVRAQTPSAALAPPSQDSQSSSDEPERGPSVGGSRVGYVDSALPFSNFRLRYEAGYDFHRPNRAEFFYAQNQPTGGPGLRLRETSIDYQDFTAYVETAPAERFSAFVEVPARLLNPEQNANTAGLADMNAGVKYAFLCQEDLVATLQFRTYIPTGAASHGLGTGHVSLEPALLLYDRLSGRWTFEGELRYWVPVGGTDFAGDIIRYGIGLSYDLLRTGSVQVAPVAELVGWTVLGGKESGVTADPLAAVQGAAGDTIVNAKLGLRVKLGCRTDVYAGYGRPLTGERWYESVWRFDLRVAF